MVAVPDSGHLMVADYKSNSLTVFNAIGKIIIISVIKLIASHFSGEKDTTITVSVAASLLKFLPFSHVIFASLNARTCVALQMQLRVTFIISFGIRAAESRHLLTGASFKLDIDLHYASGLVCV